MVPLAPIITGITLVFTFHYSIYYYYYYYYCMPVWTPMLESWSVSTSLSWLCTKLKRKMTDAVQLGCR